MEAERCDVNFPFYYGRGGIETRTWFKQSEGFQRRDVTCCVNSTGLHTDEVFGKTFFCFCELAKIVLICPYLDLPYNQHHLFPFHPSTVISNHSVLHKLAMDLESIPGIDPGWDTSPHTHTLFHTTFFQCFTSVFSFTHTRILINANQL